MDANRGWDTTSDEDDGMEIDLDAKQDDSNDRKRSSGAEGVYLLKFSYSLQVYR